MCALLYLDILAISEVIDAVEDELKAKEGNKNNNFIPLAVAIAGALVATKLVAGFFFR